MTSTLLDDRPTRNHPSTSQRGATIEARHLSRVLRRGERVLSDVSLRIEPGQLVAVIGASGAGKTTLLETLAGIRLPSTGQMLLDGRELHAGTAVTTAIGYVPQDDIVHRELTVRSTIRHAARLRLDHPTPADLDHAADDVLRTLGLTDRADTTVSQLSGGQRKRVSIGVELLTRPGAFFLDEPTSGLDPGTARQLLVTLRDLAAAGSTVVLTTHSPDDVAQCDQVVVLGRGGRLLYHGPPEVAPHHFGVNDLASMYAVLDGYVPPADDQPGHTAQPPLLAPQPAPSRRPPPPRSCRMARQWAALSHRNVEILVRNRLTLAIMLGAPALVVAMFVVLFEPGAFDSVTGDPGTAVGIASWLAFAAFFFGLTYGLLQVCTELAVVRREHHVGMSLGAYVLAKLTVLIPVLVGVNTAMVVALRATGRLPGLDGRSLAALVFLLVLDAVAALALGLLASAAVADPSHATLALPLLCFPAVLFGGAVLPVPAMAVVGQAISAVTQDRWAFEAIGRVLHLSSRFGGDQALFVDGQHGDAFHGSALAPALVLVAFAATATAGTFGVLRRRTAPR